MPPKLEVNTQCMVPLYAFRYVTMCVCTFNWAQRISRVKKMERKKGNKTAHLNESSKLVDRKASRVYDLHPPLFLMTLNPARKGLVQLLSMYIQQRHKYKHKQTNQLTKPANLIGQNKPAYTGYNHSGTSTRVHTNKEKYR